MNPADLVFQADIEGFVWLFILVAAGVFNLIKKGMTQVNRSAPPVRQPAPPTSPSSGPPPAPGAGSPPAPPPVRRPGSENIQDYFERLQREFQKTIAPAGSPARAPRATRPPPPPPPPVPRRPHIEEDVSPPVAAMPSHTPIGNPLSMGRAGASLSARDQSRSIRCGAEAMRMPMYGLQMQVDSTSRGAPAGKPRLRTRREIQRAVVSAIILGPPRGLCNTEAEFRTRIGAP